MIYAAIGSGISAACDWRVRCVGLQVVSHYSHFHYVGVAWMPWDACVRSILGGPRRPVDSYQCKAWRLLFGWERLASVPCIVFLPLAVDAFYVCPADLLAALLTVSCGCKMI